MIDTDERALADEFSGDNERLVRCIKALLSLDAANALVPHGIGGLARNRLAAAACRLAQPDQSEPVESKPFATIRIHGCGPCAPDVSFKLLANRYDRSLYGRTITLYAHPDRTQAPGEWVLVPRELTVGMLEAIEETGGEVSPSGYRAMIAAAPTPPSVPGKGGAE